MVLPTRLGSFKLSDYGRAVARSLCELSATDAGSRHSQFVGFWRVVRSLAPPVDFINRVLKKLPLVLSRCCDIQRPIQSCS